MLKLLMRAAPFKFVFIPALRVCCELLEIHLEGRLE